MGSAGRLAINCFVMIGAYFLVDSEFKAERVVNLWLQVFVYCGLITLICLFTGKGDVNIVNLVQAFLPVFGRPVWFGAEYICLLILSPFLNKLLEQRHITKRLLQIFGILIIGCATLFPVEHTTPAFSELAWFSFLYLLVGYWKKYMNERSNKIWYIFAIVLGYGFICGVKLLDGMNITYANELAGYYTNHYEALPAFACSLGLFMLFKNIKLKNNKVINSIAHVTFPVYLIHQTPAFYMYLWNGLFRVDDYVYDLRGVAYCSVIIILLFVFAVIVEAIRDKLFSITIYKSGIYSRCCYKLNKYLVLER
jgi:hypothetical protein